MIDLKIQEGQLKKFFWKWRNHKVLLNMHKMGMGLIWIHDTVQNSVILNQNVIIYLIFIYICVSVQRTAQTIFRIFPDYNNGGWCQIQQSWQWQSFLKVDFQGAIK